MDIKGKVAIVTGGASGLGEATVRRYVAHGAQVAIFDMNADRGRALVDELGDAVIYQQVNVVDEEQVAGCPGNATVAKPSVRCISATILPGLAMRPRP
jgi:NAD(P)-dependent dehydrogenase (short-subunit alcohol dehydrogenase family)